MIDIKRLRENPDEIRAALQRRNHPATNLDRILELDRARRESITRAEELLSKRNTLSKEIGALKKQGADATEQQASVRAMGDDITRLNAQVAEAETELNNTLLFLPNIPDPDVPEGADADSNVVVHHWGVVPAFDFAPLNHIQLAEKLRLLDLPRGAKITGSGFPVFVGQAAKLQRALIQFMLHLHTTKHGYTELATPYVVNTDTMRGTGQLPKFTEDMYDIPLDGQPWGERPTRHANDNFWLIPTAEVPVTNFFRDEIIEHPLPIYLTAHTPCFRREAGSAGKDTRGILRVHQFDKVELVKFVAPETSNDELEKLLANAEAVLQALGLHYRVIKLCAGDMSANAAKCYDIELWAPGHNGWLEVSSCSNFRDFQARRANIKYRGPDGKPRLAHTLNGSGVALPRLIIAILEQYQQADGTVKLPEALHPWLNGMTTLAPQELPF